MKTTTWQRGLVIAGVLAALAVFGAIAQQVAATLPGSRPARVEQVTAGPYTLRVSLYVYPAHAGLSLPYAIAPARPVAGPLRYTVTAVPTGGVDATPINGSFGAVSDASGAVRGSVAVTVRGPWLLHVEVIGPAGVGVADVPFQATAPPAIPFWLGWLIGLIPAGGLVAFLLAQRGRRVAPAPAPATR
jgi:hypothetical protein